MALVRLNQNTISYEFDPVNPSDHLGTGGMGVVFKGRRVDTENGRIDSVAIKVLFKDLPVESITRARREASIQIEHENVIRMYGCVDVVDADMKVTCHVISEFLDGVTLDKRADNGEVFSENEAIKIIKSVLSGLYMIHDKGYIHRDIDPSNVMMCKNGKIKLIDFGIVKDITGAANDAADSINSIKKGTQVGKFIGKIFYASPEQAQGLHNETDQRSDVYSVGVLFYQLLTGRVPFDGETVYEIIRQHIESPVIFDSSININIQHIIAKATAKDKSDRYQSVSEFIVDLEKYKSGIPIPAPNIGQDKKSSKSSGKAWVVVLMTLLMLLLAGGAGGYLYYIQTEAVKEVRWMVECGQIDRAIQQYESATKLFAPQSIKSELALLQDAKRELNRYYNMAAGDSLLMSDLVEIGDRGFNDGYYYSAELSMNGVLAPQDQSLAVGKLMKGVQCGSVLAIYRLGEAYLKGEYLKQDQTKATEQFDNVRLIVEQYGVDELSSELQYVYGKMYRYGYSVARDDAKAKELFVKSIATEHPGAYYELYLLLGSNKEPDAISYLNKAADLGYVKAECELASIHAKNNKNDEAVELLKRAVDKQYTPAGKQLANVYYKIAQLNKRSNSKKYIDNMSLAISAYGKNSRWSSELNAYLRPTPVEQEPTAPTKPIETEEEEKEVPEEKPAKAKPSGSSGSAIWL